MHATSARERRIAAAGMLSLLLSVAGNAAAQQTAANKPATEKAAAGVPAPLQQLIDAGKVKFEFYDPLRNRPRYPGRTEFLFYVDHQYRFQHDQARRGTKSFLTIQPTMQKVTCRVEHKMILPQRLNSDDRWNDRLLRHEFDHVVISTDPRIAMLAEHLLRKIRRITVEVDPRQQVDKRYIDGVVSEEIRQRRDAVIGLIQANYQRLDDVTHHGILPLADREKFFTSLYTEENLQQADFPFAADAADLLRSRAYRATLPRQVPEQ